MPEQPWPVAPRPFEDEIFGSWFGRIATRYRIGVEQLAEVAGIELDLGVRGGTWLVSPPPAGRAARQLAMLSRLPEAQITGMPPTVRFEAPRLVYCFRCLFLNPLDIAAPYWKVDWLRNEPQPCELHPEHMGWIPLSALRLRPNMHRLLNYVSERWHRPVGRFTRT